MQWQQDDATIAGSHDCLLFANNDDDLPPTQPDGKNLKEVEIIPTEHYDYFESNI